MLLRNLRAQFKATMPISDGFFALMDETFGFYTQLCNDFFAGIGNHVEENTIGEFLQEEIRPRLFDSEYCRSIEKTKKQFLAEHLKLEQFIEESNFDQNFLNDLSALKKVSDAIFELLQTHWEFFKYEKRVASNEILVAFILEIDRVGIRWDSYLDKYLASSSILKEAGGEVQKENFTNVLVQYHFPAEVPFSINMCTDLINFLNSVYDFVIKVHDDYEDEIEELEVNAIEAKNPVSCILAVPDRYVESYKELLHYLSLDVLKRETLVKYVMEIVRLRQGKEITRQAITAFQKKIAKQLELLHPEGYLSVDQNEADDSVAILTSLCKELDRLNIDYNDMLAGASERLARNRIQSLSKLTSAVNISGFQNIVPLAHKSDPESFEKRGKKDKTLETKKDRPSTVTIDIKNKEHIGHLTS